MSRKEKKININNKKNNKEIYKVELVSNFSVLKYRVKEGEENKNINLKANYNLVLLIHKTAGIF
jgi:hypothetical protein